jgi:hypothetical protein
MNYILSKIYIINNKTIKDNTFIVELCGVGTVISTTHHKCLNFTFNVLSNKDLSSSGFII